VRNVGDLHSSDYELDHIRDGLKKQAPTTEIEVAPFMTVTSTFRDHSAPALFDFRRHTAGFLE
jgi:hypothetical protein